MLSLFSQSRVKPSSIISQNSLNAYTSKAFNSFIKRNESPLFKSSRFLELQSSLKLQQNVFLQFKNYHTKKSMTTNPLFSKAFKINSIGRLHIPSLTLTRSFRANWVQNSTTSRLDGIDPDKLSKGLILINVVVFALIQFAFLEKNPAKREQLRSWIRNNMTFSGINFKQGRIWTMFTSSFTHFDFWHLVTNLISLYFFAPTVAASLGSRRFLQLYFASCITSHLTFFSYSQLYKNRPVGNTGLVEGDLTGSIGASGSTMAILAYFGLKFPREIIYLYFVPVPAFIAVGGVFIYDYIRCRRPAHFNGAEINHVAHLGGALSGIIFFLLTRRPPPTIRPNAFGRYR